MGGKGGSINCLIFVFTFIGRKELQICKQTHNGNTNGKECFSASSLAHEGLGDKGIHCVTD